MHHAEPRTIVPRLQPRLAFDRTVESATRPDELDATGGGLHGVRLAIAHSNAVVAAGLADLIRQRTTWDVRVLAKGDGAPWDDLIGKHVVVLDEQTMQRAVRANHGRTADRLPWTRLVLIGAVGGASTSQLEAAGIDATIRPCSVDALVHALGPLLAALHDGQERGRDVATGRSAFAQPGPRAGGARGPRGGLAPLALRQVREHVLAHVDERIDVAQLAAIARLSACHFARAFRQSTGVPPHRYVLIRRIEFAAGLIRDTDRSVADIAATVGFADQSHFTRTFARITGDTPSAFRRSHR